MQPPQRRACGRAGGASRARPHRCRWGRRARSGTAAASRARSRSRAAARRRCGGPAPGGGPRRCRRARRTGSPSGGRGRRPGPPRTRVVHRSSWSKRAARRGRIRCSAAPAVRSAPRRARSGAGARLGGVPSPVARRRPARARPAPRPGRSADAAARRGGRARAAPGLRRRRCRTAPPASRRVPSASRARTASQSTYAVEQLARGQRVGQRAARTRRLGIRPRTGLPANGISTNPLRVGLELRAARGSVLEHVASARRARTSRRCRSCSRSDAAP